MCVCVSNERMHGDAQTAHPPKPPGSLQAEPATSRPTGDTERSETYLYRRVM